jgi:arylformamidase
MKPKYCIPVAFMIMAITTAAHADRGELRERLKERLQQRSSATASSDAITGVDAQDLSDLGGGGNAMSCDEWARKVNRLQKHTDGKNAGPAPDLKNVAYGHENLEKLDVFLPGKKSTVTLAPIILMVHGGGWCVGDKGGAMMTESKVARWVPKGFVFISINYPMINDGSNALAQASHVAKAAAFVQANAQKWGGDPTKLVLMGHSAGAHLVSLVNASAKIRQASGMRPILGTVSLDAGAIDVVKQMPNVYPFLKTRYREAFGTTEAEWITASPFHQFDASAAPWLGVCSSTRKDDPCGQAKAYADKSKSLGIKAAVQPEHKNHSAINKELGKPGDYTSKVESFMASLDPLMAQLLK